MITLYKPNETDFTHNGIGALDKNIYNTTVEEELNGLFLFSFSYPLFAPHGLEIEGMSIIKVPTRMVNNYFEWQRLKSVWVRLQHNVITFL